MTSERQPALDAIDPVGNFLVFHLSFDSGATVHDRRMVTTSDESSDGREGHRRELLGEIHHDLAREDDVLGPAGRQYVAHRKFKFVAHGVDDFSQ